MVHYYVIVTILTKMRIFFNREKREFGLFKKVARFGAFLSIFGNLYLLLVAVLKNLLIKIDFLLFQHYTLFFLYIILVHQFRQGSLVFHSLVIEKAIKIL